MFQSRLHTRTQNSLIVVLPIRLPFTASLGPVRK
jgi:hypothetical protein